MVTATDINHDLQFGLTWQGRAVLNLPYFIVTYILNFAVVLNIGIQSESSYKIPMHTLLLTRLKCKCVKEIGPL